MVDTSLYSGNSNVAPAAAPAIPSTDRKRNVSTRNENCKSENNYCHSKSIDKIHSQ